MHFVIYIVIKGPLHEMSYRRKKSKENTHTLSFNAGPVRFDLVLLPFVEKAMVHMELCDGGNEQRKQSLTSPMWALSYLFMCLTGCYPGALDQT